MKEDTTGLQFSHAQYLRKELSKILKPQYGKYTNKSTGIEANLNGRSLKKLGSDKAIEKTKANGFTITEHFEGAVRIADLFQKAKLIENRPDREWHRNILSIKRFTARFKTSSGRNAKAFITVKESVQNGHTIYSLELFSLK